MYREASDQTVRNAQDDLNFHWANMSKGMFSDNFPFLFTDNQDSSEESVHQKEQTCPL